MIVVPSDTCDVTDCDAPAKVGSTRRGQKVRTCMAHRAAPADAIFDCDHETVRNLYDQRPPSEGRKLVPKRKLCEDCGAVLPHPESEYGDGV